MDIRGLSLDHSEISTEIHRQSNDIYGYPCIIHGYPLINHGISSDYSWISMDDPEGRGAKFRHSQMFGGKFQVNFGELRGQSKIISSTIPDDVLSFLNICGIDPVSIWEHFGSVP
jgi:hypothetical protein